MSRCTVAYHHGDLPAALLDAVESAVAECGASGVSLRGVARRAGVSHGAPAHHFGSKAGLLTAFATRAYRLLAQTMRDDLAALGDADAAAEVAAMGQSYVRFAVTHPSHFEVMFRQDALIPADRELAAARDEVYGQLSASVERCHQAGRLPGRAAETAVISAWSLAHGLAALWISGRISERTGEQDPQRVAEAVTNLFVGAVLPPLPAAGQPEAGR